jgi:hypothetical protein
MFEEIENPIKILRTLKGAPLSVYMAMYLAGQPVSAKWLETVTGYSDKPITKAIDLLIEYELINKNHRGYIISGVKQLKLCAEKKINKEKYRLLHEFGIGEPILKELAAREDQTIEYIKSMISDARIKKISPNLLIHKIRSGDRPLGLIDLEDQNRYLTGPYGDIGKHW